MPDARTRHRQNLAMLRVTDPAAYRRALIRQAIPHALWLGPVFVGGVLFVLAVTP